MISSILSGVILVFLFCLAFGIVVLEVSGAIFIISELLVRLMKIGSKLRSWWAMKNGNGSLRNVSMMHLRQIVIVLTVSILRKGIPVMVIVTIATYIGRKHQMMGSVGVLLERSD